MAKFNIRADDKVSAQDGGVKLLGGYVGQRAKYGGVKQPVDGRFTVGPASRTLSSWKRSGRKVCKRGSSSISTGLKMQLNCQQRPQVREGVNKNKLAARRSFIPIHITRGSKGRPTGSQEVKG